MEWHDRLRDVYLSASVSAQAARSSLIANAYLEIADQARSSIKAFDSAKEHPAGSPIRVCALPLALWAATSDGPEVAEILYDDIASFYDPFGLSGPNSAHPLDQTVYARPLSAHRGQTPGQSLSLYLTLIIATLGAQKTRPPMRHSQRGAERTVAAIDQTVKSVLGLNVASAQMAVAVPSDFCTATSHPGCCKAHDTQRAASFHASVLARSADGLNLDLDDHARSGLLIMTAYDTVDAQQYCFPFPRGRTEGIASDFVYTLSSCIHDLEGIVENDDVHRTVVWFRKWFPKVSDLLSEISYAAKNAQQAYADRPA